MSAALGGAASVATQSNANSTPQANGFAELNSGEFMKIILSELSNQDPLKPNDTAAILEQLSSIRSIESQVQLEDKLDSLVTQNSISSSTGMIGKYVKGMDENNNTVEGIVESLSIQDGKPVLNIAGEGPLDAERVTEVEDLGDLDTQVVQQMLASLQVLDSGALIGREINGTVADPSGAPRAVSGKVTGVRVVEGQVQLELDTNETLPLSGVTGFKASGN